MTLPSTLLRPLFFLLCAGSSLLCGCATPTPNDLVELHPGATMRYALSTEDGIVALAGDDLAGEKVPIRYWYRVSPIRDDAVVVRRTAELSLLRPEKTRLQWSEFAALGPEPGENLYVQVIDEEDPEHRPGLVGVSLFADGAYGDLLAIDDWFVSADDLAGRFAGAGVYAERKGRYVLVGALNGAIASNPEPSGFRRFFGPSDLLTYVSLESIAAVLPQTSRFFEERVRAFRPDFEYGLTPEGKEPPPRDPSPRN